MRSLQYTLVLLLFFVCSTLSAQDDPRLKTTYPVDSCLYFMEPFQFLVRGDLLTTPGGGQAANILFRSTSNPDILVRGQGRIFFNPEDFQGSTGLLDSVRAFMLMEAPEPPPGSDNWPGGQPPFPLVLSAFVQRVDGNPLAPWRAVTIRVNRIFFEVLTE